MGNNIVDSLQGLSDYSFCKFDMADWIKREYGKGAIDRAGEYLKNWWVSSEDTDSHEEWSKQFGILENWRTSHDFPLTSVQRALRNRAQKIEKHVIVARRLKRFPSIMNKLARESAMKLSQMQDLGGCRAILSNVNAVQLLFEMYGGEAPLLPSEGSRKCDDYIKNPKTDGYRGIHIVERYHSHSELFVPWDRQRIEIQLRTQLQHSFATAVETVTTFTRAPLKFGAGPAEWRRFFSLMGSALATREQTPLVPNTPTSNAELIRELRDASNSLKVHQRLRGWADALKTLRSQHMKDSQLLLLVLDMSQNTVKAQGFKERTDAMQAIAEIEKSKNSNLDAVLVWVSSFRRLRAAYPNYYADTGKFLVTLDAALAGKQ